MRKGRLPEIALAAGALLLTFVVAEIGLWLAGYDLPRLLPAEVRADYRIEPGAHFVYRGFLPGTFEDFANEVRLNELGLHDRDYPAERPEPDTHRVMVLGDSYVAAFEVPVEETFHKRVERRLQAEDPLNVGSYQWPAFGRGNRAQADQLRWLRQYGPRYRPDVVLLVFFAGNDVMENSPILFERAGRFGRRYMREVVPRKQRFFDRWMVLPFSRINGLLAEAATGYYAANLDRWVEELDRSELVSPELGLYEEPPSRVWREAWERTIVLLERIQRESERLDARFVVAGLAGPQAVGDTGLARMWSAESEGIDWDRPLERVERWAAEAGVPYLELTPALEEAGRRRVYWRHDAHLTPVGHRVVADSLYEFLYGSGGVLR